MIRTLLIVLVISVAIWVAYAKAEICPAAILNVTIIPHQVMSSITLEWDAPTTNTDDTPLIDLGGYTVYKGPDAISLSPIADINDPLVTTYQTTLSSGIHYFGVSAWDTETPRNESLISNIVSEILP